VERGASGPALKARVADRSGHRPWLPVVAHHATLRRAGKAGSERGHARARERERAWAGAGKAELG
jgi:hypothetical protein